MASSPASYFTPDYYDEPSEQQPPSPPLNSTATVLLIFFLVCAMLFIASLHILAKWFLWRSRNRFPSQLHHDQAPHGGLGHDAIGLLPTFTYRSSMVIAECAICLTEFQESEKGRMLPACKHSFHTECIDMWFYSHSSCPLCRTGVFPTITTPPLISAGVLSTHDQQEIQEEEDTISPHEIQIAIVTPSAHDSNLNAPVAAATSTIWFAKM